MGAGWVADPSAPAEHLLNLADFPGDKSLAVDLSAARSQRNHTRKTMRTLATTICLALVLAASETSAQSGQSDARSAVIDVSRDDPIMEAAKRKGQATLPEFLKLAAKPRPAMENLSLKIGLSAGSKREFIWVGPFEQLPDQSFSGRLANEPRHVQNLKRGDTVRFKQGDIIDWLYVENGKMHGSFTTCALARTKAMVATFKANLGLDCEL
jgi:uncharacterized protein YegJ (DUF2314 family)